MQKNHSTLYSLLGAVLILLSCGKQTPSALTFPLELDQDTLFAKKIFRLSDFYNTSDWIVPNDAKNLEVKLDWKSSINRLWSAEDCLTDIPIKGGSEKKTVRIDIPPIGESLSMDVPFSVEIPWSIGSDAVPEIYKQLFSVEIYQLGDVQYDFGEDMPFFRLNSDIRVGLPSFISPDPSYPDFHVTDGNGYRFKFMTYGPLDMQVHMFASLDISKDGQTMSDRKFRVDSNLQVSGTLHLEKKWLKEGREWPDHLDFSFSSQHDGYVSHVSGLFDLPSTFTLPDISFAYPLQIRPFLFQQESPNIHLYDTRVFLLFSNYTPFLSRIRGTVASYKNGEVLHSIPFGAETPLEDVPYDPRHELRSDHPGKMVILSEFDHYPYPILQYTSPYPKYPDFQKKVALPAEGLSSLFVGDPDDIRITDLTIERDPDEIVDMVPYGIDHVYYSVGARIGNPLEFAEDFSARTRLSASFSKEVLNARAPLYKVVIEGTLTSTLPFHVELEKIVGYDRDVLVTWDEVTLPPSIGRKKTSAHFTMQLESKKQLAKRQLDTDLCFRLFADKTCAGRPVGESDYIALTDLVIKY